METEFREESFAIAQTLAGARGEDRPHADAVRARVAVGEPDRDVDHRRPAHARAVAGLPVGALGTAWSADDEALVDSLVRPGHPSTPGYTDPRYPPTGRVVDA